MKIPSALEPQCLAAIVWYFSEKVKIRILCLIPKKRRPHENC